MRSVGRILRGVSGIFRHKFPREFPQAPPLPFDGPSTHSPSLAAESGGIAYEALKTALEALRGPAGMFPPLKTAVEGIISILTIVDVRDLLAHIATSEY